MSGQLLESLRLIHNRHSKLEEGQLMAKRNRVIHSFLAENNPTAL